MAEQKIDERMEEVNKALDEYENKIGLPALAPPGAEEELNRYLNMNRDELRTLSQVECGEIAYRLAQFSLYVQRLINKEKARRTWAGNIAKQTIAPLLSSYDKYTKYSVKVDLISRENSTLTKLRNIMRYARQRIQRLEFVSNGIRFMAETLTDLRRAKIAERKTNAN